MSVYLSPFTFFFITEQERLHKNIHGILQYTTA